MADYPDLTKMTFYEVIPYRRIRQLILFLSNDPLFFEGKFASLASGYHRIMRILQGLYSQGIIQGSNLIVPVRYSKHNVAPIIEGRQIGRVYPVDEISCGCLPAELRGSLLKDNYIYLDISSSHSTVLMALCMASGIKCQRLQEYHYNREFLLSRAMEVYGISRDVAKVAFIGCMNMGTYKKWAQKYNIDKPEWEFLHKLRCEMQDIINQFKKLYPNYLEAIKEQTKYKHDGVFESWLVQDFEYMILSLICSISPQLAEHAVLNFDGIMVLKEAYTEGLEEHISQQLSDILNVKVRLKIDEMTNIDMDSTNEEYFEEDCRLIHKEKYEKDMSLLKDIGHLQLEHLRDIATFEGLVECFIRFGMNQNSEDYCARHAVVKWCNDLQIEQYKEVTKADIRRQMWDFLSSV